MAMLPPRCARLFSPHSDFSQDVGARCSGCPTGACSSQRKAQSASGRRVSLVPNMKREMFGTLTRHQDDTGFSRRRVSFKLVRPTSSRNRARAGVSVGENVEGHNCSQRMCV